MMPVVDQVKEKAVQHLPDCYSTTLSIGSVELKNNVILAPLAGITNLPFRLLAKREGCGLVCSEMISANGLVYGSEKTARLMDSELEEKPLSVQIFGSDPSIMADAACMVAEAGVDILDVNFGCSVKKIVKTGSGVALMRTPDLARKILTAIRRAISIPLTIKIRTGWESSGEEAMNLAAIAEECGVNALTVHPRTASQGFRGKADWALIGRVKRKMRIPVIGNGDIVQASDAIEMLSQTGCDGVMIGRSAIGNPQIFRQIVALQQGREMPPIELAHHFALMKEYLAASVRYCGEMHACRMMRSRLGWFVKGLPHNSRFRESIKQMTTQEQGDTLIEAYRRRLIKEENNKGKAGRPSLNF